jgi:hypothetical protein
LSFVHQGHLDASFQSDTQSGLHYSLNGAVCMLLLSAFYRKYQKQSISMELIELNPDFEENEGILPLKIVSVRTKFANPECNC